ncbi:mycofactocin biosynthesis peptidyl-dipeptidase MftE [Naumannella halotolerans]|uniref:Creatinine amidohydrolase n=1 Tax=Naumannella halotolerans TaxID=993414 RepID=A0A4R7J7C5_9ACTN|nr:mycofactocin biosynthesis peptidyl-dipeptidase MftE [Naumannella halotolerans]TDT33340.1 creatinine amidohydrolase [Naumannella halotolerans]
MTAPLGERCWPELAAAPESLVLLPLGAVEQHGPHLPLITDTLIAERVAAAAAGKLEGRILVAPAISYGASGEHEGFPGTVSVGAHALQLLLLEYGRSCLRWASRLVIVNAHGGNLAPLTQAVARLRYEGRDVTWFACAPAASAADDRDSHAGAWETSLVLHLRPELVDLPAMAPGVTQPLSALLPSMLLDGVRGVSASGVLGDPTRATGKAGAEHFAGIVDRLVEAITTPVTSAAGRLGAEVAGR